MVLQNKIMVKIILGSKTEVVCARVGGANTTPFLFSEFFTAYFAKQNVNVGDFEKRSIWNPARIPPQTPPAGGKSAEAKRKIQIPRKKDFRFAESALKPHALPEYLEGRTPKEKHLFLFQEKIHPRQIRNARSVFSFGVAGVLARAWGFGSFIQFPLEKSSRKVYNYSTRSNFFGIKNMERFCGSQNRALIFAKTLSAYGGSCEIP